MAGGNGGSGAQGRYAGAAGGQGYQGGKGDNALTASSMVAFGGAGGGGAGGGAGGQGFNAGPGGTGGTVAQPDGGNGSDNGRGSGGSGGGGGFNGNGAAQNPMVLVNATPLEGGNGGKGGNGGGIGGGGGGGGGGYGAVVTGATANQNLSSITGGNGGNGGAAGSGGDGGDGGNGVQFTTSNANLVNFGSIQGGNGGTGGPANGILSSQGNAGLGGAGVVGSNLAILNAGTIQGGTGRSGQADAITFTGGDNRLFLSIGGTVGMLSGAISVGETLKIDPGTDVGSSVTLGNVLRDYTAPGGTTPIAGSIEKVGVGTLILSGANTYTGGTTLTAGTLVLDHATNGRIDAAGTGVIRLADGAQELRFAASGRMTNSIQGFGIDDVIGLRTITYKGAEFSVSGSTIFVAEAIESGGDFNVLSLGRAANGYHYTLVDDGAGFAALKLVAKPAGSNVAPTLAAQTFSGSEAGLTGTLAGTDANGDVLAYKLVKPVAGLTLNEDGSFSYTGKALAAGAAGSVTFQATATDGMATSKAATVTLKLTGVNDGPDAVADIVAYTGKAGAAQAITAATLLKNDVDPDKGDVLSITKVQPGVSGGTQVSDSVVQLAHGTVSLTKTGLSYDPTETVFSIGTGDRITDTFSYTIKDKTGLTDTATVTLSLTGQNVAATATQALTSGSDLVSVDVAALKNVAFSGTTLKPVATLTGFDAAKDVLALVNERGSFHATSAADYAGAATLKDYAGKAAAILELGQSTVFSVGADSYLYVEQNAGSAFDAGDGLVKLAGVSGLAVAHGLLLA